MIIQKITISFFLSALSFSQETFPGSGASAANHNFMVSVVLAIACTNVSQFARFREREKASDRKAKLADEIDLKIDIRHPGTVGTVHRRAVPSTLSHRAEIASHCSAGQTYCVGARILMGVTAEGKLSQRPTLSTR